MSEAKTKSSERSEKPKSVDLHSPARERSLATQEGFGLMDVRQTAGNLALQRLFRAGAIKAKLTISQPHDSEEQEADRVADRIMRMEDPGTISSSSGIHRKCVACESGGSPCPSCAEDERIQRKESAGTAPQSSTSLYSMIAGPRHGGEPLSPSIRTFFEPKLGRDLSDVRVHKGKEAAESARSIHARAYTAGNDIVFSEGQYSPGNHDGRKLLAHELAHVAQSRRGVIARKLTQSYSTIESDLTYGVLDWAITETECDEVLGILTALSPDDLEDTVRQMQSEGLVTRLTENVSATARTANATLLQRIQEIALAGSSGGTVPVVHAAAQPIPEGAIRAPETFDPCLVDVYALTNAGLLSYYQRAIWVVKQGRGAVGYLENRNLQRRLIIERDRRVELGHAWLATMPETIPQTLRQIVDDGLPGSFQVLDVPPTTVAGAPEDHSGAPVMTGAQFDHFLGTHNIERVDADTYIMRRRPPDIIGPSMLGTSLTLGGLYNAPGDLPLMWRPVGTPPLAPGEISPWPLLPEVFYRPGYFMQFPQYMQSDLLLNPPAMNPELAARMRGMLRAYRRAPGVPSREVNALIVDPNAPVTAGTAAVAVTDIPNLRRARTGGASAEALPPNLRGTPGATGGSVFKPVNPTAVDHAEHVALENLRVEIDRALALGDITRADLRGRTVHVMVEQEPCPSCGSGAGAGPPGILEQFARRYPELTLEVRNVRNPLRTYVYRSGVLLNPRGTAPALPTDINPPVGDIVESVMSPEYARTLRYGGGAGGELRAMGASGLQGAGMSGFIAVATSAGIMAFDTREHPEWAQELALTGGLGAGAGFLGSATEQLIVSQGTRSVVSSIEVAGASRLTPGLVRGMGRAGGGGVGAMFIEGISIGLLEEREHFAPEVATRMTRSAALGAGSIWAGAAIGTAAGSAVPVVGNAVGFIVGLGAGTILYFVGDRVVPGGRDDWDAYEAGCHFRSSSAGDREPIERCFTADTPVRMADGTQRRIDQLREGDNVLSCDERDSSLHSGKVLKIERSIAPAHLKLYLAKSGLTVGLTGEHPIHTEGLWLPAKMLSVGSIVTWLDDGIFEVGKTEIASVTANSRPTDVYDLTVSDYHTFFAGGILAHNKNI